MGDAGAVVSGSRTRWLLAVVLVLVVVGRPGTVSAHDGGSESSFVSSINSERAARGLPSLAVHGSIAATSCDWNHQMANSNTLAHDPGLVGDAGRAAPNWRRVGENVGVGADVGSLHTAFMNSPTHRNNILDPGYTHIGVCVDRGSDGRMWTTHRFLQLSAPPPPY